MGTTAYGVDLKMMEEEGEGGEAEGEVAQQVAAGRTLVDAMMTIFSSSCLATSSAWMRMASMLPELRVLITSLAYTFPDRPFANLLQVGIAAPLLGPLPLCQMPAHPVPHQLCPPCTTGCQPCSRTACCAGCTDLHAPC